MTRLVEVHETSNGYVLREIYISPKHVVSLREDTRFKKKLKEGTLPSTLNQDHIFTKVVLDKGSAGLEIVVVGDPRTVESQLNSNKRELLNG